MKRNSPIHSLILVAFAYLFLFPDFGRAGGTVTGWGGNTSGQISPCASNVVAVAAGYQHSLLLTEGGTVADCGRFPSADGNGFPIIVPSGLSNIIAVAAGDTHSLALKNDGTVVAWGVSGVQTNLPQGLTNILAISAGSLESLALKADGTVVRWGNGVTNLPPNLVNIVAISSGRGNNLALKADGTVVGWGFNGDQMAALASLSNIVAISAGDDCCYEKWVVLRSDGIVIRFVPGSGANTVVQSNSIAIAGSLGTDHHISLALKANGTVEGWGYNFYGGPNVPPGLMNVVAVASGGTHNLALVGGGPPFLVNRLLDRTAVMSGKTFFRIEATGARPLSYQWRFNGTNLLGATSAVLALTNVQPSQAGFYSVRVSNAYGVATNENVLLTLQPFQITVQPQSQTNFVNGTSMLNVAVQGIEPIYYQWRRNNVDLTGATNSQLTLSNLQMAQAGVYSVIISNAFDITVSSNATLTVVPVLITTQPQDQVGFLGGTAGLSVAAQGIEPISFQWRFNNVNLAGATHISLSLTNLRQDRMGYYSVTLSNSAGTVSSRQAQLSVVNVATWGNLSQPNTPADLTNAIAIATGYYHGLALRADGAVVAWGGDSPSLTNLPAGLTSAVAVASGCYAFGSLALKDDGAVAMWGYNGYDHPPYVSLAASLSNVVATAGGQSHMLALRADGTVVSWGYNTGVPSGLTNAVAVAAGQDHSLALKADGTVIAWGSNSKGQTDVPAGLSNAVAVAAGGEHSVALRDDGTVIVWGGSSFHGQTNLPTGLTNVVAIAAGVHYSLALKADGTVVSWNYLSDIPTGLTNVAAIAAGGGGHNLALVGDGPPVLRAPFLSPARDSNGFRVFIPTQSGRVYRLEYKNSLADGNWTALPLIAGDGNLRILTDSTATSIQRFYRVRRW